LSDLNLGQYKDEQTTPTLVIQMSQVLYIGPYCPRTNHEGPECSEGLDRIFLQSLRYLGWVVNATTKPLYPRERGLRDQVSIVQEIGWVPGPVWAAAENLAQPRFDPQIFQHVASHYS